MLPFCVNVRGRPQPGSLRFYLPNTSCSSAFPACPDVKSLQVKMVALLAAASVRREDVGLHLSRGCLRGGGPRSLGRTPGQQEQRFRLVVEFRLGPLRWSHPQPSRHQPLPVLSGSLGDAPATSLLRPNQNETTGFEFEFGPQGEVCLLPFTRGSSSHLTPQNRLCHHGGGSTVR